MLIHDLPQQASIDLLARMRLGRLACAHEGQPYVTPIYCAYDDNYLCSFSTLGQKITWMRANPLVCVEADELASPRDWATVIVFGRYEELPKTREHEAHRKCAYDLLQRRGRCDRRGWPRSQRSEIAYALDHFGRAVVGAGDATQELKAGDMVTVSCAEGEVGRVYEGQIPFETARIAVGTLKRPRTAIMVNLGNPDLAFATAMLPNEGVGLARMEFIISEHIGVHPMALAQPEKVTAAEDREAIVKLTRRYDHPSDFFIEKLSEGVGTIAAAFYPKPVIVRLSDFKTNEYAKLIGGAGFEPKEENPMLGFRGASRYAHPAYAAGFTLECAALRRVRDVMGLTNLRVMVPFCRRVEEGRRVIEAMAMNGLKQGEKGLEIYVMCEIPNNVIQIAAFSKLFDGFSIGSNDLTQLTLGVDRDSEIVAFDFDERDPGMLEMFRLAVRGAKRNGRHVGICGEAPANYPEITRFLTGLGIDSISVNAASLMRTMTVVCEAEEAGQHCVDRSVAAQ
jgi:pyruvate,water dikinase